MKPHLLVADDEEPVRRVVATYFKQLGYRVAMAASAAEALKAADEIPLNLVILDIDFAEADGLKLLGVLKANHPNLPVILLTGMGFDEELFQEAKAKGADGYTSKNLSLEQLQMEVLRVLKYGRAASLSAR